MRYSTLVKKDAPPLPSSPNVADQAHCTDAENGGVEASGNGFLNVTPSRPVAASQLLW